MLDKGVDSISTVGMGSEVAKVVPMVAGGEPRICGSTGKGVGIAREAGHGKATRFS